MYAWISYFAVAIVETLGYMIFADTFMASKLKGRKRIIIFLAEYIVFSLLALVISYFVQVDSLPMIRVFIITVILFIFLKVFYTAPWGKCIFIGSMSVILSVMLDLTYMWMAMDLHFEGNYLPSYVSKITYIILILGMKK